MNCGDRPPARLWRDRSGVATLEAMMGLMVFTMLGLGMLDVVRITRLSGEVARIASQTADLAARADRLNDQLAISADTDPDDLGAVLSMAQQAAGGREYGEALSVTIGNISWTSGGMAVNWVRGLGDHVATGAVLSDGLTAPLGAEFIVVQARIDYDPILLDRHALFGVIGLPDHLASRAVATPRYTSLRALR